MTCLADANVLSEATRPAPDARVLAWLERHEADLWLSAITVGELRRGVALYPHGRKRAALARWLAEVLEAFGDRIVPVDRAVAEAWGEHHAAQERQGRRLPVLDSLLAATARVHGFTVATRNTADFPGVPVVNPWDEP